MDLAAKIATTVVWKLDNETDLDCGLPFGQCDKIRIVKKVILGITIVVILLTIACIIILGKYKTFLERIVCHLLAANFLSAVFTIDLTLVELLTMSQVWNFFSQNLLVLRSDGLPEDFGTSLCILQAFFIQLFDFAEFMWCLNFTLFLFLMMVKEKDTSRYERIYTMGAWSISLLSACLPFVVPGVYGPASAPFCWIVDEHGVWRFAVYWYPVLGSLSIMLLTFIYMICKAQRDIHSYPQNADAQKVKVLVRNYLKPLTAYFASFLLINLIQTANRIQNELGEPIFIVVVLHMVSISSYGVVLCTLFFATNGKKEFTKKKFLKGLGDMKEKIKSCERPTVDNEFEIEVEVIVDHNQDNRGIDNPAEEI